LHLVDGVVKGSAHAESKLLVLLCLLSKCLLFLLLPEFLFGRTLSLLLLAELVEVSDVSNSGTLVVNNVAVLVNLLAVALSDLTSSELTNDVSVLINDETFAVDLEAGARVSALFLLLRLPSLRLADGVTVAVNNITILVDVAVLECCAITFDELTADLAVRADDSAVLLDLAGEESSERTLLLTSTLSLGKELSTTDNVATIVPDLTLTIGDLAYKGSWVSFNDNTVKGAVLIDKLACLVDTLASKLRTVNLLLRLFFRLLPAFSVTEDVTHAVDNVTFWVDLLASKLLGLAVSDLTNLLTARNNVSVLLDDSVGVVLEWTRLLNAALVGRYWLGLPYNLTLRNVLAREREWTRT
jgi:hypothetical protein